MSRWQGKYVIGLTGNIATGKSVVRKMLEHLGAYGIDADALAHRAIARDAPAYDRVVKSFGEWVLDKHGQIDRARLARVVFNDPGALQRLESIIHPFVGQAIDLLIRRSSQFVIVIEAIKLLETDLHQDCSAIWVVDSSQALQLERIMEKRGQPLEVAQQRINSQSDQHEKLQAADVVISNLGSFDQTWEQVLDAWERIPWPAAPPAEEVLPPARVGEIRIRRGHPHDADLIAGFINAVSRGAKRLTREDVMGAFGEKAYMLIERDGNLQGLAGWQVENLVTRVDEIYLDGDLPIAQVIPQVMAAVESASSELQSEASLLFLPPDLNQYSETWEEIGYLQVSVKGLGVRAWQEAAVETMPRGASLWFKKLREERILRPL